MEILFRGKRVDSGEWVYGQLWVNRTATRETAHIVLDDGDMEKVEFSTVGQYTGLDDKNGVKIFDGDIAENANIIVYANKTTKRLFSVGVVKYDVKNGCMVIHNTNGTTKRLTKKTIDSCKIKIIGNTTFTPELLKEGIK